MLPLSPRFTSLIRLADIAALAVFLASAAAKSISGQMLPVDSDVRQAS
jgi:hypothetical protein